MTSRDFCYWLQGYFEIGPENEPLSQRQIHIIKNHLAMVFKHEIDPSHGDAAHQKELSKLHEGGAAGEPPKLMGQGFPSKGPTYYRC